MTPGRASAALLAAVAAAAAAGCASPVIHTTPVPYVAVEARVDDATLYIRYLSPDGILYSESSWPAELRSGSGRADEVSVFVLTPLETGREPPSGESSGRRLPLLGPEEFGRLRDAAIEASVPRDGRSAIVVRMQGRDVTVFHDADGRLRSVTGEPPAHVRVVERLELRDYLAAAPGTLERVLREQGIGSSDVLFNTGDGGEDALPFVYVNLDGSTAAFVRVRPPGSPPATLDEPLLPITQSVTHVVGSHTLGLLSRPITSLTRLFFAITDTVRDTLPDWPTAPVPAEVPPLADSPGMDLATWEAEIDAMTGRRAGTGAVSYLIDGEAFFTRLEQVVQDAAEKIELRMYIFDNDDYALRFADLLRERAAAGIDVRVLLDGLGTLAGALQPPAGLPEGYEPPMSMPAYLAEDSDVEVRTAPNPFFTGDHTKTIVVDDEIAFLGGMNIGREYRYEWHDMMAEIEGPVVAELGDDFDTAWAGAGFWGDLGEFLCRLGPGREPAPPTGYSLRVLYTRPTASEIRNVQLAAARRAQRYIYLENAYLTDDAFLRELVRARLRGVDVRVVVPLRSDRGVLARDNILAANVMFGSGIRVYIYPGMSHVKAAAYDDWICLGSANADQLSLRINREANIATSAPEAVVPLLEELFEADFRASVEMTEEFPTQWHDHLWELVGDYVF